MKKAKTKIRIWMYLLLSIVGIILGVVTCHADNNVLIPITGVCHYGEAQRFVKILNEKRKAKNLAELKPTSGLTEAAMQRAAEIVVSFAHRCPYNENSTGCYDALERLGYVCSFRGIPREDQYGTIYVAETGDFFALHENIGSGFGNAETADYFWSKSPLHNAAMMAEDMRYCGVGVLDYHNTSYWVFVAAADPCGEVINTQSDKERTFNVIANPQQLQLETGASSIRLQYGTSTRDNMEFCTKYSEGYTFYAESSNFFTITNNNPELISVDSLGKIRGKKVGTGSVTVKIKNGGTYTVPVTVERQTGAQYGTEVKKITASLEKTEYTYNGEAIEPKPVVRDMDGTIMKEGTDYVLEYENSAGCPPISTDVDKETIYACVRIYSAKGSSYGNYDGALLAKVDYHINTSRSYYEMKLDKKIYEGNPYREIEPKVTVKIKSNGKILKEGVDYFLRYDNNYVPDSGINEGQITVYSTLKNQSTHCTVNGELMNYQGTPVYGILKFQIKNKDEKIIPTVKNNTTVNSVKMKASLKKTTVVYNGKAQKPRIKEVKVGNNKISSKYYSISYKNNKNVGTGYAVIRGKGKYKSYSCTVKFKIIPKSTMIKKITAAKNTAKVKWKKVSGAGGYQIQCSTSKNFKNAKTKTVKNITALKISKLSGKRTYYVRIRSWKKVGKNVYYSGWSKVKKVKIK